MGGSDKKTNQLLESQRQQQTAEHNAAMTQQNQRSNDAYNRQTDMYNSMFGGLDNFIKTGGVSDDQAARLRGIIGSASSGSGGGGGYYGGSPIDVNALGLGEMENWMRDSITGKTVDTNRLRAGNDTITNLMKTGGYTPQMIEELGNNVGLLNSIAETGGVDPEAMGRIRGLGLYDEYAKTGGIDARTEALMRDRATSVIPSLYDNIKRSANQQSSITGSTAGKAALLSKNAREQAQAMSSASRDAELGIYDRRDEGRRWGANSASSAESGLQSLISSNKLNALNSAAGITRGMGEFQAGMGFNAAKQLNEGEIPIQQMLLGERQYGISGMEQIIQQRIAEQQRQQAMQAAAAEAANADARAALEAQYDNERYLMEYGNEGKQFGIKGMMGLYGTAPAESQMYIDSELARRGLNNNATSDNIQQQFNNRSRVGENILGLVGTAAGVGGAFLTGGATSRRPRNLRPGDAGYGVLQ